MSSDETGQRAAHPDRPAAAEGGESPWAGTIRRPISEWRNGLPVLPGERVTLREPVPSDAEPLHRLLTTRTVKQYMTRPPGTPAAFGHFIAWIQAERRSGRCVCFGIVPEGEAHAVGLIQLRPLEPSFGLAEWGFAMGQPYWGTGLFREAARLAVDFAFRDMGVHRLEARTAVANERGNAAMARLGAQPEGVLRQSLINGRRRIDQVIWSLLSEDWLAAHPVPLSPRERTVTGQPELPAAAEPVENGRLAWRAGLPTLQGPTVGVRELVYSDAASLFALLTVPEVAQFIPPPPASLDGFHRFIQWSHERRAAGTHLCFGIVPRGASDAVGLFQILRLDPSCRTAEWGFALGAPFWGKGLFFDGAQLVLRFIFDTLHVKRLEARTPTGNVRGEGALRKLGATREAQLRRSFLLGGRYSDDYLWSILDRDYRKRLRGQP